MRIESSSLLAKILIILFAITAIFTLFFLKDMEMTKEAMVELEKAKIDATIKSRLPAISDAVYFGFDKPINEIGHDLLTANRDLLAVTIRTQKGEVFHFARPEYDQKAEGGAYHKHFPILQGGRRIGVVEVAYDPLLARSYFLKYRYNAVLFSGLIIVVIVLAFWYLYRKIRSLNLLAERLKNVEPGRVKSIEGQDTYFELQSVVNAVNGLLGKIDEYASNLKRANRQLLTNRERLMDAQRIAQMASWTFWPDTRDLEVSREFYRMFELNRRKVKRVEVEKILEMIHPEDRQRFVESIREAIGRGGRFDIVHRIITSRGKLRYLHTEGRVRKSRHSPVEVVGVSMDVTEETEAKQLADHMAFHDPLTGLPNRRAFMERMNQMLLMAHRQQERLAILFIDLDNFKIINDSYGHSIGDKLLVHVASTLRRSVRDSDLIARIGGDEFIVVLNGVGEKEAIEGIVEKILRKVTDRYDIDGRDCTVTVSAGVAFYPDHGESADLLLRNADAAMYEAKKLGKNRYLIFNDSIKRQMQEQLKIVEEMKRALDREDEIVLYFQPQIDLRSGRVRGAEVLTRWHHPERGVLFPGSYIPVIESTSLMARYDRYVLRQSFRQLYEWQKAGATWTLGVNLSAYQFNERGLIDELAGLLKEFPLDPAYMELEITESMPMQDMEASISMLRRIKEMGFKISIDDFGTGYSSLSYLKRLPFDVIKIDREFVKEMHIHDDDVVIVKLMVQIAKTLGKEVVAEGLEKSEHIRILEALSCDYAQGFYYSKAVDRASFEAYARKQARL